MPWAAKVDEAYIKQCNAQGFYPAMYYPHNIHFLWSSASMQGQSKVALEAARKLADNVSLEQIDQFPTVEFFKTVPLLTLDEVAVLPAGHALAHQPVLDLADFAGEFFVSLSADDPYRRLIDARFAEAGVERTLRVETHSAAAVCAMVEQGLGIAIVNPVTALAACSERLVLRRLAFSIPFSVTALLPLYRPPLPEVVPMLDALRAQAHAIAERLPPAMD